MYKIYFLNLFNIEIKFYKLNNNGLLLRLGTIPNIPIKFII